MLVTPCGTAVIYAYRYFCEAYLQSYDDPATTGTGTVLQYLYLFTEYRYPIVFTHDASGCLYGTEGSLEFIRIVSCCDLDCLSTGTGTP